MKNYKIIFTLLCLLLTGFDVVKAQIADYEVPVLNGNGGTLLVQPQQTLINYNVTFQATSNGSGGINPYDVQVCLGVVRDDANGNPYYVEVTPRHEVHDSDFASGTYFLTESFSDVIKTSAFTGTADADDNLYLLVYPSSPFTTPTTFNPNYYNYQVGGFYPYDDMPLNCLSTTFNYSDPVSVNATIIPTSDTQPILTVGQAIYSPNVAYKLTLQTDGNMVLYKVAGNTPLWSSRTQGHASASVYFQTDGNLVIYTSGTPTTTHSPIWNSGIYNHAGLNTVYNATYYLQDDGNFVEYWPAYLGYVYQFNYKVIIFAASDTQGGILGPHPGNLNHPLWQNNPNQAPGSGFNN